MHLTADDACLQGETALYSAIMHGRYKMVVLLLAKDADVGANSEGTDTMVSSLTQLKMPAGVGRPSAPKHKDPLAQPSSFLSHALCSLAHWAPRFPKSCCIY